MIDTEKVILPTRITCVCVRAWVGVFVSKNVIFKFRKKQQQQQQNKTNKHHLIVGYNYIYLFQKVGQWIVQSVLELRRIEEKCV